MMGWGNMWGYGYSNGFFGNGNWWMGLIPAALQLIFWAAVIGIGIKLFSNYSSKTSEGRLTKDRSLDILHERYARGEIDLEEYNRRKYDLSVE